MKRVLLLIAVAWVASACGGDDDGVTYFVGAVSQSDVVIGVSSKQGLAKLYVCGGDATYQDTTRWLEGTLDNDGGSFAANDGWSATVTRVGSTLTGKVTTPDKRELSFDASAAAAGTIAGLYGVLDDGCMTGVVVRQPSAGDAPTAQGVWCASDGTVAQVTPVMPLVLSASGLAVRVNVAGAQRELTVSLVAP
ncbi:MAG: hypothetical protein KC503_17625 [Myxococcales bacterium]|nr:hypothetical protein [Myxococcales bacterium]